MGKKDDIIAKMLKKMHGGKTVREASKNAARDHAKLMKRAAEVGDKRAGREHDEA